MKKVAFLFISVFFLCAVGHSQSTVTLETRYSSGTGGWTARQAKLVNLIQGYSPVTNPSTLNVNSYGSSNSVQSEAKGFFYAQKIDNRWWLIDPEGKGAVNIAVNVIPTISDNISLKEVYDRLWELGFNGAASFMADESQTMRYNNMSPNKFSYTRRINFYNTYVGLRKSYYPTTSTRLTGSMLNYMFVFDPKFAEFCESRAKTFGDAYKNERDLLGYFLDNELQFHTDQLQKLIRDLDPGDPSYEMAMSFATSKGLTKTQVLNNYSSISSAIKAEFATKLADKYYEVTTTAIRKYDPNHIVMGSRLHGGSRDTQGIVQSAAKWNDVVSVNFYDTYSPVDQITSPTKYLAWIDKPLVIGEFYTKGYDAYENGFVTGFNGAGWVVKTQTHRGYFYQNTCIEFLKARSVIGWHYFQYSDDADSNKGMFKLVVYGGEEYTELTSQMRLLNINRFNLINHFDGRTSVKTIEMQNVQYSVANNILHISGYSPDSDLRILDIAGKVISSTSLPGIIAEHDLSHLSRGVYIVHLLSADKSRHFKAKIIK